MTEEQLAELIRSHEADRIEFTVSTRDSDKFAEAVCAFANDLPDHRRPGHLIIGIDNAGRFAGISVTDELLRNLGGLRDDGNIQPLPAITVEKLVTESGEVAVVTVQPSLLPPVRYKGRVCIRVGPRRGYATDHEMHLLVERRVSRARTFDSEPCLGSRLEELSLPLFLVDYRHHAIAPEIIEENHRPAEEQLASLRFFDLGNDCPTNAGILLFGREVRRSLPGAYIQFLRVGGVSLADPVENEREIDGDLLTMLRELDALVQAQLAQYPSPETSLRERTVETLPQVALREILLNAVMHRDYASTSPLRVGWFADRVEIQSPGGLYGEATARNFPRQTSYRNPVIAEAMKALGYVNRYGRGVIRAQEALRRNGNPLAEFEFDDGYVLVTLRLRQ